MQRVRLVLNKQKDYDDQGTRLVGLNELDTISDSSCEYLECEVLDYLGYDDRSKFLHTAIQKLRIGCELFIRCLEFGAVYRSLTNNTIGLEHFNQLIYGNGKRSIDTLKNLITQVQGPVNITSAGYNKETYWLRGIRC